MNWVIIFNIKRQKEIISTLASCQEHKNPDNYFKELRELGNKLINDEQFHGQVNFLNAIGNKERLTILIILKNKERCVCELEAILDKSQPSISHHLRILEAIGIIKGWKKGKFTYYGIENRTFKIKLTDLIAKLSV